MELMLARGDDARALDMERTDAGYFELVHKSAGPGSLYRFRVDGRGPFPDPASRYQPQGVHGPSQVVDPGVYRWHDDDWKGVELADVVLYELHVGTFTRPGTFRAAIERLPHLVALGVTALELMPVADFPGDRNWGYDGVALFAPARCYGTPDDLRALVDAAHVAGLAVHLDVVYNHFGPDGAYQGAFSPSYFSDRHRSPWGAGINFDGPGSEGVRHYVVENALRWVHEYHIDGLRLDATHAIVDESPRHIVAELAGAVHASEPARARRVLVIAEDMRNLAHIVKPESGDDAHAETPGWGLDAVWSDDFHHQMRVALAGDRDAWFGDFAGTAKDIATTVSNGWFYSGQVAPYFGRARGTDSSGVPMSRFVFFLQNHDQTGNRAMGDRLHHAVAPAAFRAASVLLLLAPETPLLFMGQEWAASAPFRFFTDHHPELGRAVTEGRRREFRHFAAFSDPATNASIPDPQARETFVSSRLDWDERSRDLHAGMLRLYRSLLALRRREPACRAGMLTGSAVALSAGRDVVALWRTAPRARSVVAIVCLRGSGTVDLASLRGDEERLWTPLLTTEDPSFATDAAPLRIDRGAPRVAFTRPGAVVLAGPRVDPRTSREALDFTLHRRILRLSEADAPDLPDAHVPVDAAPDDLAPASPKSD